MTDFDKNLKQAKKIFVDESDQEQIKKWELEHKKAELWVNLGEHPAMKDLIQLLADSVIDIDLQLNEQKVLTQEDIIKRLGLENKKEVYNWFLELFSRAKTTVEAIEKEVKSNFEET